MAVSLRHLKIRHQILVVTLPPLFVLLCAVGLFFYAYWMAIATQQAASRAEQSLARGESLLRNLTEMFTSARDFALTGRPEMAADYQGALSEVQYNLKVLRSLEAETPPQVIEVDEIRAEIERLNNNWAKPLVDQVKRGQRPDISAVLPEGENIMASARSKVLRLISEDRAENMTTVDEARRTMGRMLMLGVTLAVLLGAGLLLVTRMVTRMIGEPVLQLISASEQVSRGEFNPALPPAVDNEFGVLSRSFAHMTNVVRREREEIAALNKYSEAVTQCTSEREVHDLLMHWLRERFKPRQVIIFKLNPQENFLEVVESLVQLPEDRRAWPVIEEPHKCKAVRTGRYFRVNDVTAEPPCPSHFALPGEGSYYCGPLIAGGIIIGAVRLEGLKDFWTPERERLLESYLSGAASALSNLRLLATMTEQANVDVLTGLYNRRFLEDYARKLLAMARRREQPVGVIMMDLDHFKTFNDIHGHEVGDRVLRQFAKTITTSMRETNLASRYGGEEFVLLLPDAGPKACLLVAERIRLAALHMVVPSVAERPLPQVTVSLGIAVFPEHGQTFEEVLQASDKALYESKRGGRNRATLYLPLEEPAS
ncbi:MAG: diguanylate cyclase [Acidobacteriia bacterium]|nr:diguanylate cyclase [Terriglobia bacterium]